jgi:hypothetical protein
LKLQNKRGEIIIFLFRNVFVSSRRSSASH